MGGASGATSFETDPPRAQARNPMRLYLKIQIGEDDYLLDAARIRRVVPLMDLKRIPRAPPQLLLGAVARI